MSTSYPNNLDNFSNPAAGDLQSTGHSSQHSNLNDAIEAIQAALGILPQGGFASVRARIEEVEGDVAALGSGAIASLVDGTVAGSKLADNAVTTAKIADNAVTAAKVATDAVTTAKIANNAVSSTKIANGAILPTHHADFSYATAAARDAAITSPKKGTVVLISTTPALLTLYNGTAWETLYSSSSYTPALTNISVGSGGSTENVAYYTFMGGYLVIWGRAVLGSSGASVSGIPTFSLPSGYSMKSYYTLTSTNARVGDASLIDSAPAALYMGSVWWASTTTFAIRVENASSTYLQRTDTSSTVPITWTAGDSIVYNVRVMATAPTG